VIRIKAEREFLKFLPNPLIASRINFAGMDIILAKIRAVRKSKGISQEQLAEKIGVDLKTYGNWETGKTDMTFRMLERIAKAIEVPVKVFWDPAQFDDPDWKPDEAVKFSLTGVNEAESEYMPGTHQLYNDLIETKNKLIAQQAELIKIQKEEIERLKSKTGS
jgi:transcriptional regulator with XRE-family HTH domain